MSEVLKIDDSRELDHNFAVDGEENAEGHGCRNLATDNEIQVEFNKQGQGQQDSSSLHVGLREENMRCSYGKSHSVPTEFDQDNAGRTNIDYDQERTQSPSNGKHYQGEMDELPGSYFQKSSFEFKAQTLHDERGAEGSAYPQESPLTADSNQVEETECNPDVNKPNTSHQDEEIKDALLEKSTYEFTNSPDKEMEGQTIEHQTEKLSSYSRSPSGDGEGEPRNEKYNSSKNSPSESGKLDMSHSISPSPGSIHRRSASPVTVNQTLVSPEGSPHLSPNGHSPSLPLQEGVQYELHSRTQHKQKHAASPERSDLAKRISPNGRLSPSATQSSASPKRSRHKNGSSLKHMSTSPKPRYSPKKYQRNDRSMSRSPIQQRDPSSGYGRNYHDRSRSRSPYMRNHYRSPRRRYSPRRRSPPGYHSRHHSPRRRPWSPPPNRRTGVGKPGKNLFVAGFSFLTTERDLERKFSRFGRVQDVRIVRDKRSGDSRGFGFLSLETDEDADAAIRALDETEWNGRVILVEKSKSTR